MAACPSCCRRGIPPSVAHRTAGRLVSAYDCPACGHAWTTSRLLVTYIHRSIRKEAS